ncbi:MAG TPA: molybdenum cofactor guanylyltransferase [Bryobacteraceae bacterium]|nr:molybdenum cofactor guanylyltransferase [Bryobacteraceae bacterium]
MPGITAENTNVDGTIRCVSAIDGSGGLAGWVLVGGASTRMGRDKALIDFGGRPLALVAAEALGAVCHSVSLVGDPERYQILGLPVVSDRSRGSGPLSGIEAALGATCSDWNLIAACDMPSLDSALLRQLAESAANDAAIPRYPDGRIEPLCALYHRRSHAAAAAALAAGARRVSDFIARLTVRYIEVADSRPFLNLNTPEDLENYRRG